LAAIKYSIEILSVLPLPDPPIHHRPLISICIQMSFFIWHLLHFICYICRQPQLRYIPTGIDTDIYSLVYICMHVAGGCPFGYATPLTIHVPCVAQRPMRILRAVEGLAAPPDLVLNFFHFFVTHATHEYGPIGAWSACAWTWAARRLRG